MSSQIISKEILQRLDESNFKEVALRKDSMPHYFYLSKIADEPGDPIGVIEDIDVSHVTAGVESNADKMYVLSMVDSQIIVAEGGLSLPIYLYFPDLDPSTRYHFVVSPGFNSFNNSNSMSIVCNKFPGNRLKIRYGVAPYNNDIQQQTQFVPFTDAGSAIQIESLNIRFKVQSITLN